MPKLTVRGFGTCDVEEGKRLVLAIEGCGVDIGHRCGGQARCTTCRVRFEEGEPSVMTRAEFGKLTANNLLVEGIRLSCQIVVDRDMTLEPLMRVSEAGWPDPGPPPANQVEPDPQRFSREELEAEAI